MSKDSENLIKHRKRKSLTVIWVALFYYWKERYSNMQHEWGSPSFRPLWLEAIKYAIIREWRFVSRGFNEWCDEVDALMIIEFGLKPSHTIETGRDCWIEAYVDGMTPEDAVHSAAYYWD